MFEIDDLFGLLQSTDESEWSNALFRIAYNCGFEQTVYGVIPDKRQPLENAFLRSNYAPNWRQIYDSEKLHYVDPTVAHCLKSTVPLVWEPGIFKSPVEQQFYEEACSYGLRSGITYPIHGPDNQFGVISFVRDSNSGKDFMSDLRHVMASLALIRDFVFESSLKFIPSRTRSLREVRLTNRELECLQWAMAGKSSWEISRILNRSEATINFHIANIKQKFEVGSRQQAIIKAIRLGLLRLD